MRPVNLVRLVSRWPVAAPPGSNLGGGEWDGGGGKRRVQGTEAPAPEEAYSDHTLRSLENIDEAQLNYDLVSQATSPESSWVSHQGL